jgi:acyl-CoA dehydrogenase
LIEQSVTTQRIAQARILIEQSRLLTMKAAVTMDAIGNKGARAEIAMIKVAAPSMAAQVIDWAIQAFGGGGTSNDHFLAAAYATARLLRLADGPDEVHLDQVARLEIKRLRDTDPAKTGGAADPLPLNVIREYLGGPKW